MQLPQHYTVTLHM